MVTSIRKLRLLMQEVLSEIGNVVHISKRGKTCVKIVPVDQIEYVKLVSLAGMWKDYKEIMDVAGFVRQIRKPR